MALFFRTGRVLGAAHCRRGRTRAHDVTAAAARSTCWLSVTQRSDAAAPRRPGRTLACSADTRRGGQSQGGLDHQGKSTASILIVKMLNVKC